MRYEIHKSGGGGSYCATYRPGAAALPTSAAFGVTADDCAASVRNRIAAGMLPAGEIVVADDCDHCS